MTINVCVVTSEAIIFGCDSISSISQWYLDPFQSAVTDESGNLVADDDGNYTVKFRNADLTNLVTSAWGGVTKMFAVHDHTNPAAAVTAGLAQLNGQNIAALAGEFRRLCSLSACSSVEEVATRFQAFFRAKWEEHYKSSNLPDELRSDLNFLLGGFGENDSFPNLYRINVKANSCKPELSGTGGGDPGGIFGLGKQIRSNDCYLAMIRR